jgi:PTH1 family peptidyl-tRNA hydrolase
MAAEKWLIVGLGNPGPAYSHNRHNVGYWSINRLARLHGIPLKARRLATIGEGSIAGVPVHLAKPRTFVNRSGHAVAALLRNFRIKPERMLVICDDLDLPAGRLRLRPGGGHGGQKGLRSIVRTIGSGDFPRLRIGIGRPVVDGEPSWEPEVVADYVLSDPASEEAEALQAATGEGAEAAETVLREGLEAAMNRYNR